MGKTASRFAILCVATLPACALAGRATTPAEEATRERSYSAGTSALDDGDFARAAGHLASVAAICPVDGAGRRAMLLLAAAELDPRNRDGRPDAAAELSAFQIARPDAADGWAAVLAAELYALALDYGAAPIPSDDLPDAGVIWSRYLTEAEFARRREGRPGGEPVAGDAPDSAGVPAAPGAVARAVPTVAAPRAGGPLCDVPAPRRDVALPQLTRAPLVARAQPGGQRPPAGAEDVRALMAENDRLRAELASKEQELDRIRRTLRP